jgi:hypothetical protein
MLFGEEIRRVVKGSQGKGFVKEGKYQRREEEEIYRKMKSRMGKCIKMRENKRKRMLGKQMTAEGGENVLFGKGLGGWGGIWTKNRPLIRNKKGDYYPKSYNSFTVYVHLLRHMINTGAMEKRSKNTKKPCSRECGK